jgi:hypothetical protein
MVRRSRSGGTGCLAVRGRDDARPVQCETSTCGLVVPQLKQRSSDAPIRVPQFAQFTTRLDSSRAQYTLPAG